MKSRVDGRHDKRPGSFSTRRTNLPVIVLAWWRAEAACRSKKRPQAPPSALPRCILTGWGEGAIAPSSAKSCSPRICLGSWLRLLRRPLFSPPSVCSLSISQDHPNSCKPPELLPLPWRTPSWESVWGPCSHSFSSLEEEQSWGLGVVILQTVMEPREGGQGANTGSKQQPGFSGL